MKPLTSSLAMCGQLCVHVWNAFGSCSTYREAPKIFRLNGKYARHVGIHRLFALSPPNNRPPHLQTHLFPTKNKKPPNKWNVPSRHKEGRPRHYSHGLSSIVRFGPCSKCSTSTRNRMLSYYSFFFTSLAENECVFHSIPFGRKRSCTKSGPEK